MASARVISRMCHGGTYMTSPICAKRYLTRLLALRQNVPMGKQRHFIREWRKFRNLNQEQLAERIHISRPQLSKIEMNTREADLALLERIAEALMTDPASLIMRDPSDPDGIWSIWDTLSPPERRQGIEL